MGQVICSVSDCERPFSCRGLCELHYGQARRRGKLDGLPYLRDPAASLEDRFWAKVNKTETCWLWTAHDNGLGYGQFWVPEKQRLVYAHRFAYELLVGPIPEGLVLDHLCLTPRCVNPRHLEAAAFRENVARAARLKTHCPQGHPYDIANTWLDKYGKRHCRACNRDRAREYDRRKRAERKAART